MKSSIIIDKNFIIILFINNIIALIEVLVMKFIKQFVSFVTLARHFANITNSLLKIINSVAFIGNFTATVKSTEMVVTVIINLINSITFFEDFVTSIKVTIMVIIKLITKFIINFKLNFEKVTTKYYKIIIRRY